jgi:hypothetical protein
VLSSLPFRLVLTSALTANLAVGPTLLSAHDARADVSSLTIRSNTRLVIVDVIVTDKKGQPVTGLKPEDFTNRNQGGNDDRFRCRLRSSHLHTTTCFHATARHLARLQLCGCCAMDEQAAPATLLGASLHTVVLSLAELVRRTNHPSVPVGGMLVTE